MVAGGMPGLGLGGRGLGLGGGTLGLVLRSAAGRGLLAGQGLVSWPRFSSSLGEHSNELSGMTK